jgi:hypothetical protein
MTENPIPAETTPPHPEAAQQETPPPQSQGKPDRYKIIIIALTMLTTIVTAVVAGLQADANIRSNNANRDSQYYAMLAAGELQRLGLQGNYDINTMSEYLRESQTSLVMQITALEQTEQGDEDAAAVSNLMALGAQARADKAQSFSIFYTDPRYAPTTDDGLPNAEAYLADAHTKANELALQQNTAADEYHLWNNKADIYVSILTVLAVAFFLFGLAQALKEGMRLTFTIFGTVTLTAAILWTVLTVIA